MTTVGVLLAAGASRRFGSTDKLLAPLFGQPLVTHAAQALAAAGPDTLVAVTRSSEVSAILNGYETVAPAQTDPDQADSLRAGLVRASALGATRAIVTLGDMPFVTPELIRTVVSRSTAITPAAATDGRRPMPPACFPAVHFPDLMALTGDRGAATLLKALPPSALVAASSAILCDIDTQDGLDAAQNGV